MSLKAHVARSTLWSGVQIMGNQTTSFLVFLVLTHFLSPSDIGVVALAVSFIEIMTPLMRAGLPEALIQRETLDEIEADTCFWSGLGLSLVMGAGLFLLAPVIATSFASPTLGTVLQALSALLPITALSATHEGRLTRAFGFKALAMRTLIANLLSGLIGIVMALDGYGVWSLVAQRLIGSMIAVGLIWLSCRWVPRLRFSTAAFKQMSGFGAHMTLVTFLMSLNGRIFDFLLGFFMGPAAVGFMRVASRVLDMVTQFAVNPLTSVALPTMARLQHDRLALSRAFLRLVRTSALMTFPAYFGLALVAPDLVTLAFGRQWAPSGELLSILCLSAIPITLQYFTWPAMAAVGRSDLAARGILVIVASATVITAIAAPFGLTAVVVAHVVRTYLTLPLSLYLLRRSTGIESRPVLAAVAYPLAAAIVMALALLLLRPLLHGLPPTSRIGLMMVAGVVVYGGLVLTTARALVRDLRTAFSRA
ncbi:lipopolysaccharide biosynthesis protein [Sphingomonas crusticola]|uniref:lipopolysaccharide biosynthesis protein n=1 Tax=Sphingomonas crusticola TaxID=1697973 RepID=UPI0013C2D34B|nr:lipopolysaccharide biosynthesis protein [Sphingomonas crusticola]